LELNRPDSSLPESPQGLVAVLLLSLLLKTVICSFTEVINVDGALYLNVAQTFEAGRFKDAASLFPMPFYPLLLAGVHLLVPQWTVAAYFTSVASSVLVLVPLYLIARRLFDDRAAFWTCLAWAVCPEANDWGTQIMRDPPFLLFFAWAVHFTLKAMEDPKVRYFLLTALFLALGALLRIEALIFTLFTIGFFLTLAFYCPDRRRFIWRGLLCWLLLLLGAGMLLAIILGDQWTAFNRADQISQALRELLGLRFLDNYLLIYEKLKIFQQELPYPDGGQNFMEISRHYMPMIYLVGLAESYASFLFAPFLLPLFLGVRRANPRSPSVGREGRLFTASGIVLFVIVVYYRHVEMNFITQRYLLSAAFLAYPWIGRGLDLLWTRCREASYRSMLTALLVLAFVAAPVYKSLKPLGDQDPLVKRAGQWLVEHPRYREVKILSTDARIPYYAGLGPNYIQHSRSIPLSMEDFALSQQVDLIILRTSLKNRGFTPRFQHYRQVQSIQGRKDMAMFYASESLLSRLSGKD